MKSLIFRRASHCFGRSALSLSGGSGLIYFHHGVVDALLEEAFEHTGRYINISIAPAERHQTSRINECYYLA